MIGGLNIFINSIAGYIDSGEPSCPMIGGLNIFIRVDSISGYID